MDKDDAETEHDRFDRANDGLAAVKRAVERLGRAGPVTEPAGPLPTGRDRLTAITDPTLSAGFVGRVAESFGPDDFPLVPDVIGLFRLPNDGSPAFSRATLHTRATDILVRIGPACRSAVLDALTDPLLTVARMRPTLWAFPPIPMAELADRLAGHVQDHEVRNRYADLLSETGHRDAVCEILLAAYPAGDPTFRRGVADDLTRYAPDDGVLGAVAALAVTPGVRADDFVLPLAADRSTDGEPAVLTPLLAAMENADAVVRRRACLAINRLGRRAGSAIPRLSAATADPDEIVRRMAAVAARDITSAGG